VKAIQYITMVMPSFHISCSYDVFQFVFACSFVSGTISPIRWERTAEYQSDRSYNQFICRMFTSSVC